MTATHPRVSYKLWDPFPPRSLPPIYPHFESGDHIDLPSPPRRAAFDPNFTLSTHIIPASHLRLGPHISIPDLPPSNASEQEKLQAYTRLRDRFRANGLFFATKQENHQNVLWNVVNRYVRRTDAHNAVGVTLFFVPANGAPKEIWEPIIRRIISSPAGKIIDEIWAWDHIQHGDAAVINAKRLTAYFDWRDAGRDMVNFFLHFLPSTVNHGTSLPLHLPRVSVTDTQARISTGFQHRRIIAVCHSYSATAICLGALQCPKIFSSLVLIDPVMVRPDYPPQTFQPVMDWSAKALMNALMRRDTWDSREEAYVDLASSPFCKSWDPEMVKVYVEHGSYETTSPTSGKRVVKLKQPSLQEALVYAEGAAFMESLSRLPQLDESVRLHWVMPGAKRAFEFGLPGAQRERVWVRQKNSSNVRILKAGHLVPQDAPSEFGECMEALRKGYGKR